MQKKYPFYVKTTVILLGLVLSTYALLHLADIFIPIAFALLLAILLNPLSIFFQKKRFPKTLSVTVALLIAVIIGVGVGYVIFIEISGFSSQLPLFKKKLAEILVKGQQAASQHLGITAKQQNEYINEAENGMKPVLATAMGSMLGGLSMVIVLPVYTFLFLYYKTLILDFLYELFAEENVKELNTVLTQTKSAIQSYMVGLLLEALTVATLNSIALLIIGVKYAILLGILGAILNILPFIGGILAVLLPILIATVTKDGFQAQLWTIVAYFIIQMVDNHFLVPYIVSSKVKINALISIIIVLLGGALWGVAGMFLSIPFVGVLKIIFDRIPELKPWGKLLGSEVPTRHKGQLLGIKKRSFRKPVQKEG